MLSMLQGNAYNKRLTFIIMQQISNNKNELIRQYNKKSPDSKAIILEYVGMIKTEIEDFKTGDLTDIVLYAIDGYEIACDILVFMDELNQVPTFKTIKELDQYVKYQLNKAYLSLGRNY